MHGGGGLELYHVLTVHGISSLKTILKIQNYSFKEQTFFYILSKLGEGEGVSTMSKLSTSQLRGGRGALAQGCISRTSAGDAAIEPPRAGFLDHFPLGTLQL